MKKKNIRQKTEFIQDIDVNRFISHLDQYIRTSASYADSVVSGLRPEAATDSSDHDKIRYEYKACYKSLMRESSVILLKSDKSLNHIVNFRFKLNGQSKGIPETDEKTYLYFRKIKRHQMLLLAAISDEVEIIASMIKESEKIRKIIQSHTWMLKKAAYLMDVLGERIESRPTLLLSIEGEGDEKVRELNETFEDMNKYEDTYEKRFRAESENHNPERSSSVYKKIIQDSHHEIEIRKKNILSGIRELNEGWNFLNKLVLNGYSRKMRRGLDNMSDKHKQRESEFQEYVQKCRSDYGFSGGNIREKKEKKQKKSSPSAEKKSFR